MSTQQLQQEIDSITHQLVNRYSAEKVILFGSAARDVEKAHDVDLLVVKQLISPDALARTREVRRLIQKRVAADFFVLTPQELNERLQLGDPFVTQIVQKGKVLHG